MEKIKIAPEAEKEKRERLLSLVDRINAYAIELVREKKYAEHDKYAEEIRSLRKELERKYGEGLFYRSELYHALTDSTMSKEINKMLDLPGGEWEAFIEKKIQDILEKNLKIVWRKLMFADPLGFNDQVKPLEAKIKKNFPDYLNYRLFHILIGSTIDPDWPNDHFDFPGECSVESFIINAQKEMEGKNGH
jgi:hypothetical protein